MRRLLCVLVTLACVEGASAGQQLASASAAPGNSTPISKPVPISLDVMVTGQDGKPVGGLEPFDFKLLDNRAPGKILSFRRTDGFAGSKFDPPAELIVVLDAVNLPYTAINLQRQEVEKFLRRNDGKLALPTSIFLFTSDGLRIQPAPSKDGNALAQMLDKSTGTVRARDIAGGVFSLKEQFDDSLKTIKGIAENEGHKPGRKIVVWIGSGWPLLTERYFTIANPAREYYFHELTALTRQLREARITLYNPVLVVGITRELYKGYLKPVIDPHKMEIGDMALQVLATETGGAVLGPSNDLVGEILSCQADAASYYTLTFAPPPAASPDEYHSLQVVVDQPGVTARTVTAYYDEP